MKKLTCILLAVTLLLSLSACGGASSYKADTVYAVREESAAEAPAEMAMGTSADGGPALQGNGAAETGEGAPDSRKWIITVDMTVETDNLEQLQASLDARIAQLGGFIEDQSIYNGSNRSSYRYRNANLTVRIPADRVTEFTSEVGGMANVVSNNLRREDVTLRYVDTESRVNALRTEEARLLELLASAETMTDLLEIEARLSDVRYELESYASQLRTMDNQINYATVYLYIEEVQEYTPVEDPTLWERISGGFSDSLDGLGESLQDLLVFIIVAAPYLLVYGGAAAVILVLVRKTAKKRKAKKQPKEETKEPPTEEE